MVDVMDCLDPLGPGKQLALEVVHLPSVTNVETIFSQPRVRKVSGRCFEISLRQRGSYRPAGGDSVPRPRRARFIIRTR